MLIDAETRRPIDLLPDRAVDTVATWLAKHPGHRGDLPRPVQHLQAVNREAPDAVQVADRWHLLHSLARAVERTAHAHRACLRKGAEIDEPDMPHEVLTATELAALIGPPEPNDPPDSQILARVRRWHTDIHYLRERGWTISAIARRLGRDRKTVRHYLTTDLDQILTSARERRPNGHINRFKPYLQHRFHSGATNAAARFREIREHGYRGSRVTVTKYVATLRDGTAPVEPKRAIPRPRRITWMTRALDYGPPPVQGFGAFLQNDWEAVVTGLTLHWSSGAVEGQVTRIKLIKRRSYGRASFDLPRTLVLAQPP